MQLYHQAQLTGNHFFTFFFSQQAFMLQDDSMCCINQRKEGLVAILLCQGRRKCTQNKPGGEKAVKKQLSFKKIAEPIF